MTVSSKHITLGTVATVLAALTAYQALEAPWATKEVHAADQTTNECRIARIEWSMAASELRFAARDLKNDPDNINLQRDVDNYTAEKTNAQSKITEYCS